MKNLQLEGVPDDIVEKLKGIKIQRFSGKEIFLEHVKKEIEKEKLDKYESLILQHSGILESILVVNKLAIFLTLPILT